MNSLIPSQTLRSAGRESVNFVAERIIQDITDRRLVPGDRYFTTTEVARLFAVRRATANLAMRRLASRGVLFRRTRSGTFVAQQPVGISESPVKTLFLLESADRLINDRSAPLSESVEIIRDRMPGVDVHLSMLPRTGALEHACSLVRMARAVGGVVGFILVSCPREVYRYFAETDIPAVVMSDVFADSDSLLTVDGNHLLAGRLLIDHLLKAGHRRIALLTYANWLPGDNLLLDGIMQGLEAAKLPHGALIVRSMEGQPLEFGRTAANLRQMPDPPTAFICRVLAHAEAVARACQRSNGSSEDLLEIVFGVIGGRTEESIPFPYVCQQDLKTQMGLTLDALVRLNQNPGERGEHIRLPVELVLPRQRQRPVSPNR